MNFNITVQYAEQMCNLVSVCNVSVPTHDYVNAKTHDVCLSYPRISLCRERG